MCSINELLIETRNNMKMKTCKKVCITHMRLVRLCNKSFRSYDTERSSTTKPQCITRIQLIHTFLSKFDMLVFTHHQNGYNDSYIRSAVNLCCLLSMLTLILSADSVQPVSPADIAERQNLLIRKALDGRPLRLKDSRHDPEYLPNSDVCTWEVIGCVDGVVNSLCASDIRENIRRGKYNSIAMEWLPPTMQLIHLRGIDVPNLWRLMALPRDLRYMYLSGCCDINFRDKRADFARLPQKMEELILLLSTGIGVLQFGVLPKTMRFVCLKVYRGFTTAIVVDYNNLPEALEALYVIAHKDKKLRIITVGKPRSVKLRTEYSWNTFHKKSRYYTTCDRKILRI